MEKKDTIEKTVFVKTETKKRRMPRRNNRISDGQLNKKNVQGDKN